VRFPSGVAINEKLTRRFGATLPAGTRFLGIDNDKLHFLVPREPTDGSEDVTFKFQSVREYGYAEAKFIDNLRFVGRLSTGDNLFEEVS
jgi:hypothetical protein